MIQIESVVKQKVDEIFILKDNRILIYNKDDNIIFVMNQDSFKNEIQYKIKNKINDLIILSNGNIAISIGESVHIYQINKNEFKLIQNIKLEIEKKNRMSDYRDEYIPDFTEAKCGEYKNGKYLLILKRMPFDDSKYGLYNYNSIIDVFSLNEKNYYSFVKTIKFGHEIRGRMSYNNNYLIIHGSQGANPMSSSYWVYLYDLENEVEKELNYMSYFSEYHKLYFISNNKVLHYYTEFEYYINIYNLENNEKISKKINEKDNHKIEYVSHNEKYIIFLLIKSEDVDENPEEELTFYKFDYNLNLIEELKFPCDIKMGFENVIKIKTNLLVLYGKDEMIFINHKNSSDNKNKKNMISEIFE